MGKRVLLLQQEAVGIVFRPRGKKEAIVVRVAGPNLPEDAKMVGFCYAPVLRAIGIVLESAEWPNLVASGNDGNHVGGVLVLPNAEQAIHVVTMDEPAKTYPWCAIAGYDDPPPQTDSNPLKDSASDGHAPQDAAHAQGSAPVSAEQGDG